MTANGRGMMNFAVYITPWLAIAVVSIPEYARAQWTQTAGPEGDYVFCITADSHTVYISSNGGVLASTNSGMTWNKISFPPASVSVLYSTGANLYAGTMGGGIYTSSNGGANWSAIDSGLAYVGVWRFDLFAAKDTHLYAHCWALINVNYSSRSATIILPGGLFPCRGGEALGLALPWLFLFCSFLRLLLSVFGFCLWCCSLPG